MLGGGPLLFTVGAAYDGQDQARKGYVNNKGELGDLRRDETDKVHDQDFYAQTEWSPIGAHVATGWGAPQRRAILLGRSLHHLGQSRTTAAR